MKKFLLAFALFLALSADSQTYTMGGLGVISTCSGSFFDNGGGGLNYGNNMRDSVTFCPSTAGKQIQLSFTQFDLENNWDFMYIYDGDNTSAPLIGAYTGSNSPGTINSYNFSGCITIIFTSDSSGVSAGWSANVNCINLPPPHPSDTTCALATPICTNTPLVYSANYGTNQPAFSSAYDCLSTSPNPVWLYIQAASTGTIVYNLTGFDSTASRDVDFLVWGPFASATAMCSQYSTSNVLDCSYSASNQETVTIPVVAGQYYLILITNFSNQPSTITLAQGAGSTATTNCNIGCNVVNIFTQSTPCNPANNTDSLIGYVVARNRPTSGVMKLTVSCGGIDTLSIPMPVASDTIPFVIPGVTATGGNCVITATFSSNPLCTYSKSFTSASPCICYTIPSADTVVCQGGRTQLKTTPVAGATYTWTGPNGFSAIGQYQNLVNMTLNMSGWYKVTAAKPGCIAVDSIHITVVPGFNVTVSAASDTICLHANTTLTVSASPSAVGPFQYQWYPTTIVDSPTHPTITVHPTTDTLYYVDVTAASGCRVTTTHRIYVRGNAPALSVVPSRDLLCINDTVTLVPRPLFTDLVNCGVIPLANACLTPGPQPTVKVGSSTAGSTALSPFLGDWHGIRAQYLYRASELQAMGLYSGTFTTVGFYVSTKSSAATWNFNGFTIKMGCTSLTALTDYVPNLTVVYQPQTIQSVAGLNTFDLTDPYNWDGSSNVIVEVCYDNTALTNWSLNDAVETSAAFAGASAFRLNDATPGCNLTGPTIYPDRPNTYFAMCNPATNLSYTWTAVSPTAISTLDDPTVQNPIATVSQDQTYHLVIADGNCTNSANVTVHVNPGVVITVRDTSLCGGAGADTARLIAIQPNPAPQTCVADYNVQSIPYATITPSGATTNITVTGTNDDGYANNLPIPFTFNFYCTGYNTLSFSTNGFISFGNLNTSSFSNTTIPNTATPNNIVAVLWDDLVTANRDYFTSGTAPNRVFVVRWNNATFFTGGGTFNAEVHLYEGSNLIETFVSAVANTGTKTVGVENATGSVGTPAPGWNNVGAAVTSSMGWRFTPKTQGITISGYQWSPTATIIGTSTDDTATMFTPVTQDYEVAVTFSNGCVTRDTGRVTIGNFPFVGITATPDTICPGGSSQLAFNGTGAVSYQWSPAASLNDSTVAGPSANPMSTTMYSVTATNNQGCTVSGTTQVNVRTHGAINLGGPYTICYSDSASLAPTGAPYTSFSWHDLNQTNPISSNPIYFGLPGNSYFVEVSDGLCTYRSDTAVVTAIVAPVITVGPDTTICPGDSVLLTVTPGFSSYQWNASTSTSNTAMVQSPGSYFVTVTAGGNCLYYSDTAVVGFYNVVRPLVTPSVSNLCPGDSALLMASSGYSNILWNTTSTATSFYTSVAGSYWYSARDVHTCLVQSDTAQVNQKPLPVIDFAVPKNPICSTDTIVIDAGQQTGVLYTWQPGSVSGATLTVNQSGTYSVRADLNGCIKDSSVTIGGLASPVLSLPSVTNRCSCDTGATISVTVVSGTPTSYQWSGNAGSVGNVNQIVANQSGVYTVTALDGNNCSAVASGAVNLYCLTAGITLSNPADTAIFIGDSAQLTAVSSYTNDVHYVWSPSGSVSQTEGLQTATLSDSTLQYRLEVMDTVHGCRAFDTLTVLVRSEGRFVMPTAFTPNGDGKNDRMYPVLNGGSNSAAKVTLFRIYNRWGEQVYNSPEAPGWDGTTGGQAQPSETYTYLIQVEVPKAGKPNEKETLTAKGSFLLWR
ncbi:MAG: gliding motility-associated C-terminal domain-containing protein [Chitinophagales bacterium]